MATLPIMRLLPKRAEDERVVICPDMMWGCNAMNVEITEAGLSYECVPFEDKDKTGGWKSTEHIITLYPGRIDVPTRMGRCAM